MKQKRISTQKFAKMKNRNKYNAIRTRYRGRTYDSKKEANYAAQLDLLQTAGEIDGWIPQVSLPVTPISSIRYRADFLVLKPGWEDYVEFIDVKGRDTPQSRQKRKQLMENYSIEVEVR